MNDFPLSDQDSSIIRRGVAHASAWAAQHQWELGVAEMALGATVIFSAVQSGVLEIGKDLVATGLAGVNNSAIFGAVSAGTMGSLAAAFIGSIGVVGMGTGIGIPAIALIGAGGAIFSAFGYVAGDLIHAFQQPILSDLAVGGSALMVGVALLVDGARRILQDQRVLDSVSRLSENLLVLTTFTGPILARSLADLKKITASMVALPKDEVDAAGSIASGTVVAGVSAVAAAAVSAGSVTLLGSSTLGAAALSIGLVSAPMWPVIAAGAAGLTMGYGAWKATRHYLLDRKLGDK